MKIYLITGRCGTGKTWVMQQLIQEFGLTTHRRCGQYQWVEHPESANIAVLGKYGVDDTFDGSDRLSMSVMQDNELFAAAFAGTDSLIFCEGDRFTNNTFISRFTPVIIRINGNGKAGRLQRNSKQIDRQIRAISTRIANMPYTLAVPDSESCLTLLKLQITNPTFIGGIYQNTGIELF